MNTNGTLRFVEEGMKVFDRERHQIGTVEYVQFGEDDPETPEFEAVQPDKEVHDDRLLHTIAEAFAPQDDIPEELRQKLLLQGFVRLDADGLFAADRYIMPSQIESVSGDGLMLKVSKDELLKH